MSAISDFSTEKYCPNCLARHRDAGPCPECGYLGETGRPSYALPLNTLLQGRYITGRLLRSASNEFNLAYRARDMRSDVPMVVREYFPRDLARRLEGTPIAGPSSMREAPSYSFGLKSFIGEARELRGLFDPHVIPIRHIFEENGTAYVVEDFCESQSLAQLLETTLSRLSEDDALALMLPLLDTLEAAHHKQLPHLDLRPEKVLIRNATEPVLIGFSGARIALAERTLSLQTLPSSPCTPIERYLSTREMGPWTDIYGLAAILYRLLSGRDVQDAAERCELDRLIPLAEFKPDSSPALAAALDLGLQVNRKDRPKSLTEFRRALLPASNELGTSETHAISAHAGLVRAARRLISRTATLGFALGAVVYLTILFYVGFTSLISGRDAPPPEDTNSAQDVPATPVPPRYSPPRPTESAAVAVTESKASSGDGRESFADLLERAQSGSADDWLHLAKAYEEGKGTARSVKRAVKWYRMAAEAGLPEAQAGLARIYVTGRDGQRNRQEGVRWYRESAGRGYPEAQFALGMLYELGVAVSPDMQEAVNWYRTAAENGHAMAQNRLGKLYDEGQGVPVDDQQAAAWYLRAAEQGNSDAQFNLALMYENGEGVQADRDEALRWLKLSAASGNASARQLLKKWQTRN